MTPVSHYPPVAHPEDFGPGHWESEMGMKDGKLYPIDVWVRHCPYHPFIEMRGKNPCERCATEPPPPEPR